MNNFSPSYDNKIARKYSIRTLEHKLDNKTALQEELGWPAEKKIPILCIPTGVDEKTNGALIKDVLPGILTLGVELLILGRGSSEYGKLFTEMTKQNGHRFSIIKDTAEERRKMYAAADMALFASDPSDLNELQHCLNYGVVPIASTTKALNNYNPVQESGNAFMFDRPTQWHCFAAIVRAMETYNFPFDWRTIQRHCMETARQNEEG